MRHRRGQVDIERACGLALFEKVQNGVGMPRAGTSPRIAAAIIHQVGVKSLNAWLEFIAALAHVPGFVASGAEHPGQEGGRFLRPLQAQPGTPRKHHGSAWQTHCANQEPLGIAMAEGHSTLDQSIEVGSFEHRVTEGMQAIGAMIIGMDVENVGPRARCTGSAGRHGPEQQRKGEKAELGETLHWVILGNFSTESNLYSKRGILVRHG